LPIIIIKVNILNNISLTFIYFNTTLVLTLYFSMVKVKDKNLIDFFFLSLLQDKMIYTVCVGVMLKKESVEISLLNIWIYILSMCLVYFILNK